MSASAAPWAPAEARPRLGWLPLALFAAAVLAWAGAVSVSRQSVQAAAATIAASHAASTAALAAGVAQEAHQKVALAMIDAKYDHPAALATLAPVEARLKREQDASLRALQGLGERKDALMFDRRFALARRRNDLTALAALFAAAALATGAAGAKPWPLRWTGYALAAGVSLWGALASLARVVDKLG